MQSKQKVSAFDVVAFTVFLVLAVVFWAFVRAASLVRPAEFDASLPVAAAEPTAEEPKVDEKELKLKELKSELKQQLDTVISKFVAAEPNDYGIYIKHFDSGVISRSGSDSEFITASLYKPFAVVEVLKMVDEGQLSLNMVTAAQGRNLKQCIWDTITVSDNSCGHVVLNLSGLASQLGQDELEQLGYKHTDMRGTYPVTSASDIAKLMQNIYTGQGLSSASHQLIMSALLAQKVNNRWSAELLDGAKLAHKTGDLEGYAHDAGLVLSQESGNYVIVVLSGPDSSGRLLAQRYASFAELLKQVNKVMLKYGSALNAVSSS